MIVDDLRSALFNTVPAHRRTAKSTATCTPSRMPLCRSQSTRRNDS